MCTAIDLVKQNNCKNFIILEKSSGVGGTWHDNKYPGACCDVWSQLYSYSFAQNHAWTREYPGQEEILSYLMGVAQEYNLYQHVRFNTTVENATWDDEAKKWRIHVSTAKGSKDAEFNPEYDISADWDAAPASAMECGLELSLNVYNSSVVNNVLVEHILASASHKVPGSWLPLANFNQDDLHPDGLEVDPGTLESNSIYHYTFLYRDDYALDPDALQRNISGQFKITQRTIQSTVDFLTSLIRPDNDNATVKAVTQGDQPALYIYGSPILQPLFSQTDLNTTFDAVARGMSNAIRNLGAEPMLGTTQHLVRYYQVRWAFLALPLSLITSESYQSVNGMAILANSILPVGTIFFILSIIDAHRAKVPNWKANSIATMVHGPDELLQRELRTKSHAHSLAIASETLAKLEWFPDGYALTAGQQSAAKISRPTTPVRDEEEHEMGAMRPPTSPQTPGSNVTLVEPQSGVGAERGGSRPVSPISPRPAWSSN
ncbi:hypothetical protein D6D18_09987 [Aureobasidium pullulans]|nr:hypothetical protein D6D18_09987 [Aureobasidium pullulans]